MAMLMVKYMSEAEQYSVVRDDLADIEMPKEQIVTSCMEHLICPYCGAPSGYKDSPYRDACQNLRILCTCGKVHIVKRIEMFYLYKAEDHDKQAMG